MNDKKVVWFSAFRHVAPADYENWLEKMAAEGWQTGRFRQWSSIYMTFTRGEPKKYRFVYDPQVSPRKDYIATYKQFGWEYLGRMASAHFWRMEYQGKRPEAFSDADSKADRTRRTIKAISVSFFIFIALEILYAVMLTIYRNKLSPSDKTQLIIAEAFFCLLTLALGVVALIVRKNEKR
jgi:hypothetical protein